MVREARNAAPDRKAAGSIPAGRTNPSFARTN